MNRADWRLVVDLHVAEDAEEAVRQVQANQFVERTTYFEETLGRPPGRAQDALRQGVRAGVALVGTPDEVSAGIDRLIAKSNGGFGGLLLRAHEWATREQTRHSYELFAR